MDEVKQAQDDIGEEEISSQSACDHYDEKFEKSDGEEPDIVKEIKVDRL